MDEKVDLFDTSPNDYVKRQIKENTKVNAVAEDLGLKKMDPAVKALLESEKKKNKIENSAWKELENAFGATKKCRSCAGAGVIYSGKGKAKEEMDCPVCMGTGAVSDVNMRAVELVLSPKYPKTNLNLHGDIDKMDPHAMMAVLSKILT